MSTILLLVLIFGLALAEPIPIQTLATNVATWFQPAVDGLSACPKLNSTGDDLGAVALSTEPFANGTACHSLFVHRFANAFFGKSTTPRLG